MQKFRFHLLGLCHLPTARKYLSCAFTAKNIKLSKMLCSLGHTVFLYGARSTEEPRLEDHINSDNFHFIETHNCEDIAQDYGDGDNRFESSYSWINTDFRHDFNSPKKPSTLKFYKNCIEHINKVKMPDDFLLCTQGSYHLPIRDAVGLFLNCEPGVGYRGSISRNFRAFESSYIQNFTYGSEHPFECINGSYYDRVIPNYFDPDDIEFSSVKDDYYLFIGRMIKRKGIMTADLVCRHLGKKLIIAGQGAHVDGQGRLVPNDNPDFILEPGTWEYVGFADIEKRKKLMARAIATFVPTEYLECLIPGEIILGENKPIEDYEKGEKVLQSNGQLGTINHVFNNEYTGIFYQIKSQFMMAFNVTPEHPILIATIKHRYSKELKKKHKRPNIYYCEKTEWVNASDLKIGNYVIFPKYKKEIDINTITLAGFIKERIQDVHKKKLDSVIVDEDLLWLLGIYLAEGHITRSRNHGKYIKNRGIGFTFHIKEKEFISKVINIIKSKFGYSANYNERADNSSQVVCSSYPLSAYFEDSFGSGALEKSIPWWIINLPKDKLYHFLKGYIDGDGCYVNGNCLAISTISKVLALQLQLMFSKFDILLSLVVDKRNKTFCFQGRTVYQNDKYVLRTMKKNIFNVGNNKPTTRTLYKEDADNFYIKIKKITQKNYTGKVYNLNTENNTFLVNNIITHNCFAGTHIESRLSGTPVLTTDFGVFSNTVENGLDGYKCHTLDDFVWAAKQCKNIDHALVRKRAERYLMDYVRWEYEKWFSDLFAVYESTLSPDIKGWHRIRDIEPEWRSKMSKV